MERSPAEVNMRRHCSEPADLERLRRDTMRFTSTVESYRARNRQLEKKPGSIWSVTSRSSLTILIFPLSPSVPPADLESVRHLRLPFITRSAGL